MFKRSILANFNKKKYGGNWQMDLRESRLMKVGKLIFELPPGKLLDIGCSGGDFSVQFLDKGWQVFGIEINPDQVKKANSKGIKAKTVDIGKKLPYRAKIFDLIFAGEVIEHIFDTTGFLKEAYRILKPHGKIIITTPNIASLENKIRILLGIQPIWVDFMSELSSGHIRAYTFSALKYQLQKTGFFIEKRLGGFVSPHQLRWNDINFPVLSKFGDWFPEIAQDMIVMAEKKN